MSKYSHEQIGIMFYRFKNSSNVYSIPIFKNTGVKMSKDVLDPKHHVLLYSVIIKKLKYDEQETASH